MTDWMEQEPFEVTQLDLDTTWGRNGRDFACGFCMRRFELGETIRWVAMPVEVCNTFVCAEHDGPDVRERFIARWREVVKPILLRWAD